MSACAITSWNIGSSATTSSRCHQVHTMSAAVEGGAELVVALGGLHASAGQRLRPVDVARQQRHHGPDVEGPRRLERVHRPGVPRFEPGQLLVDRVHIALCQQFADSPHVAVQREELVADVSGDLPEFCCRGQSLGRGVDTPQHVDPSTEGVAECETVAQTPGHRDRIRAQLHRPFEGSGCRHPRQGDDDQRELRGDPGPEVRVVAGQRSQGLFQQLDLLVVGVDDAEIAHRPGAQGGHGQSIGVPDRPGQRRGPVEVRVGLGLVARAVLCLGQSDQCVTEGGLVGVA